MNHVLFALFCLALLVGGYFAARWGGRTIDAALDEEARKKAAEDADLDARFDKAAQEHVTGLKWAARTDLRPDVAKAYDDGSMSNEQMTQLLRACGHDAVMDGKGRIQVSDPKKGKARWIGR